MLCASPDQDDVADALIHIVRTAPSIGDNQAAKARHRESVQAAEQSLDGRASDPAAVAFADRFTSLGQQRSQVYEAPIARRLGGPLSHSLRVRGSLKPDVVLEEYEPCAVTRASSPDEKAIELAIKRGCHVLETAHLQADMRGLDAYLGDKVRVYAELLESV